jgi:hypothetical protein
MTVHKFTGFAKKIGKTMHCIPKFLTGLPGVVALSLLSLLVLPVRVATAHEFVVALKAVGVERDSILTDALRGFLLATPERDSHADEISNGHLGGLDVYILTQPAGVAARFPELKDAPHDRPDIIVVFGPSNGVVAEIEKTDDESVIYPGTLHSDNRWTGAEARDPESFAARYIAAFGQPASRSAAEGYNAARRIDAAIRPLDGVDNRAALDRAFADSAKGIRW